MKHRYSVRGPWWVCALAMTTLLGFSYTAPPAEAVGIVNGDFEGPTAAPWRGGGDARRLCIPAGLPVNPQYGRYLGLMGPTVQVSFIRQTFSCVDEGNFCNVTFDAIFNPTNPANRAFVVLQNAGTTAVGIIPGTGTYTIAIPECLDPTTVTFIMNNTVARGSLLLIDNVTCACLPTNNTDIEPGSPGDVPELPTESELVDAVANDCNGNDNPDTLDIALGFSEDLNGDGIPDECTGPPVPAISVPGGALLALLLAALAAVFLRQRQRTADGT